MLKKILLSGAAIFSLLLLFVFALPSSYGNQNPKQDDIRQLLQLTGAADMGHQVLDDLVGSLKSQMPQVPGEYWQEFIKGFDTKQVLSGLVPIYAKYFTHQEIKEMLKFYRSPVGRKMVRVQKKIAQESMQASMQWGQQEIQQTLLELHKKSQPQAPGGQYVPQVELP